jgi:hypothetical protein
MPGGISTASPTTTMFPPSIYPPPTAVENGPNPVLCPSLSGLEVPSSGVQQGILTALNGFLFAQTELQAQTYADRAAWPAIAETWVPGSQPPKAALSPADIKVTPARGTLFAVPLQNECGARIIADSWLAVWCISSTTGFPTTPSRCLQKQPAMTDYYYFLDRNGHWLLWNLEGS